MSRAANPTAALARIVWRHAMVGWLGLALVSLLLWVPVLAAFSPRHGVPPTAGIAPILGWGLIAACFAWLAALLLGAAIDRLANHLCLHLLPAGARHLHRLLWWAFALFWLLAGIPCVVMAGPAGWWWALPWSLGTVAAALSLGLTLLALGARWRMLGLAEFAVASGSALWWPSLSDAVAGVSPPPWALQAGAFTAGVLLVGLWAWTARLVVRHATANRAHRPDRSLLHKAWPTQLQWPARTVPPARDTRWLVMPSMVSTPLADVAALAINAVALFALARWFAQGANSLAHLLPLFVFITAWSATPGGRGVWLSPRMMLVPGGGQRLGLLWSLYRRSLARGLPRAGLHSSVAAAALCLGHRLDLAQGGPWVLAALATLPCTSAIALALVPCVQGQAARAVLAFLASSVVLILTVLAGHLAFGLPLAAADLAWPWVGMALALSALLAALLLGLVARPWMRLDWAHLPASPTVRGWA